MNNLLKIDIAIISFRTELEMLDLCLSSIDKKFDFEMINNILLVWNHDEPNTKDEIAGLYERFSVYPKLSSKIKILPRSEVIGEVTLEKLSPWRSQQVLKLQSCRFLQKDHVLILDTKNHYLQDVHLSDLFDEDGVPYVSFKRYGKGPFGEFLQNSFSYFNAQLQEQFYMEALPTTTPYLMYRNLVCQMTEDIEKKEGIPFSQAFLTKPALLKTTEFLLYFAYFIHSKKTLDGLYHNVEDRNVTFFRTDPDTEERIKKKLEILNDPSTLSLGIHRDRYLTMSKLEETGFIKAWIDYGLMENQDAAEHHIQKVRKDVRAYVKP